MEMKNVLYISYDGMTDPLGQSQVIPYLVGLTKSGFTFTILSFEKKTKYAGQKEQVQNMLDAAGIRWAPLTYTKWPPVISTLYDYFRLMREATLLHQSVKYDLVHCRSYIPSLAGLAFRHKYNLPFVFDMRGFWADERVDGGLWNRKNPVFKIIYRFFKKKEIEFIKTSAAVITLTRAAKDEILRWENLRAQSEKITIIPCCVDVVLFDPQTIAHEGQQLIRERLKINQHDFVLGYLGSIGTWYMLSEMLQFFSLVKKHTQRAKFLFVTQDEPQKIIHSALKSGLNPDDIIVTQAERSEVPIMISLFSYGLFFIKPAYSKMASSPTKQGEIMAMGVPVICNSGVGDSDHIVESYDSGFLVSPGGCDNIAKKISVAAFDPQRIRNGAIDYFSLDKGTSEYLKVYNNILISYEHDA